MGRSTGVATTYWDTPVIGAGGVAKDIVFCIII